jgi:cytochrome c556
MKLKFAASALCLAVTFTNVTAQDEDFDPQPVIEGRQAALRDIGAAFKGINDELKKSQPVMPLIRQYASQIDDLVKGQRFWFPSGTGPETEIEMKAKPAIWQQPADFKAGQAALAEHAAKLAKVAAGADVAAIKAQTQALGRTCKSCHDKYREEDD